ncbi:GTP-binding protein [Paenibacillus radicis (ex Gao et al. 2016)]|uniref:Tetracycline resistance protein n=1 Tax=Paenibacillus radicis (ex Gao et al. 2016) TaxID=1737354 RepID=A0A917GWJ0_9BACL|nr:TetM/TetW/TetO/TetS family tetracycline resistance ribosomal protection protein [Paenibacillus radicis (ex Gao et al. 2016)]GGG58947.1 tetracycline resistance protein [Paenibacillus radicis (ex Gao et al. 2016)]
MSEKRKVTIGLLAHVDAGKTTFAEQLLFHTNSIRSRGRVDHQDAFLDSHKLEKARGITIFADQAVMSRGNTDYYLMDTPGHADFSAEMERALQVMDYAVIIVSAAEGIEGHTETVWQLLKSYGIPVFFFINKIDRSGADGDAVLEQIREQLTKDAVEMSGSLSENLQDSLVSFAAERDDELLEVYLEGDAEPDKVVASLRQSIKRRLLFPVLRGSALMDIGIADFLTNFELLAETDYEDSAPLAARVYKVRHDHQGTRLTYMKALRGKVTVRDDIRYIDRSGEVRQEKITAIRTFNGSKSTIVNEASAGQLFAVTGITSLAAGDGLGEGMERSHYEIVPALQSKVLFDSAIPLKEVLRCFKLLDDEDPSLGVRWDESLQELHVHVMGIIQLEVLEHVVKERFQLAVTFGEPEILYKETIGGMTIGAGHFEPLGHYAEVLLRIEPGVRDSGVEFRNECHVDELSIGYQNLIGQHVTEKEHRGLLTGSPLTDVVVTLLSGRAHNKHTSGGDFREATLRALRQGLEKADNILLEPYYAYRIKVDIEHVGRVMSDIQTAHGSMEPPEIHGNVAVFTGSVPISTFMNYGTELASYTKGRGVLTLKPDGYRPCFQSEKIIADRGYDKNADPAYTSTSIFCAKGKGFSVAWEEADSYMHIERNK